MSNNSISQSVWEVIVEIGQDIFSLRLDNSNIDSVSFNYQISDVKNISTRKQPESLALTFPYNTENALIFDNILSVNAASILFDPNLRTPCTVLVDTIEVFTGYLQVTGGNVNLYDQTAIINCSINSGNMDFWTLLGEGYITDLDFSIYDHIYGATAQMGSWYSDYNNGYFYPLIDYGYGWNAQSISGQPTINNQIGLVQFNNVLPSQLYPATYVKPIMDRIFLSTSTVSTAPDGSTYSTQPWGYTSSFFNSEIYENLLIPFSKGNFIQSINPTFSFVAGLSGQEPISGNNSFITVPYNDTTLPFGNDPFNYWDITNHWYTNTTGEYLNVSFQCSVTTQIATYSGSGIYAAGMANQINSPIFVLFREFKSDGSEDPGWAGGTGSPYPTGPNGESIWTPQSDQQPAINNSLTQQWNFVSYALDNGGYQNQIPIVSQSGIQYTTPFRYPLFPGEKVRLAIYWNVINNTIGPTDWQWKLLGNGLAPLGGNVTQIELVQNQQITIGQTIEYSNILPSNIKKKDLFTWIMNMFNLYMEPSKTLPNTLIIEPRDVYYSRGQILDWSPSGSNKLDTSQGIQIDILSNTQDRSTIFTYKDDKDYYNAEYQQLWQQTYGYFRYIRENQFSTSDGTIDVGFSPTPLVQVPGSDIVIPVFDKITYQNQTTQISNTDVNIRIVQRNPSTSGFISYSGGTNWSYAYGQITSQTFFTFLPATQSYQGQWAPASNYNVGNIVQDNTTDGDGNYYICYSDVVGSNYSNPVTFHTGTWYNPGTVVEYFLTGSGNNEYYICLHSNALAAPAGPFGNQGPVEAHYWQDFGTSPPSGNSDPANDPTHFSFYSNGVLSAQIAPEDGYPYVGHFDNPYAPTSDLNWSQTKLLFYDPELIVDFSGLGNNLINVYYANQLAQQESSTSKMITCQVYLSPQDINQLYLNSKIYLEIDGQPSYYYINSIKGFDPSQYGTTTVELLTVDDITVDDINPIALQNIVKGERKSFIIQSGGNNITNTSTGIVVGTYNNVSGSAVQVVGLGNAAVNSQNTLVIGQAQFINGVGNSIITGNSTQVINSDSIISIGNSNLIYQGGTKMLNVGDNNTVGPYSERVYVLGDNNFIYGSQSLSDVFITGDFNSTTYSNVTIFGDNITATGSGLFYLNQTLILGPEGSIPSTDITGIPNTMAYFATDGSLASIFTVSLLHKSLAEGSSTIASGNNSHAEGNGSIASSDESHAEGLATTSSGVGSHSEGIATQASGEASHAGGSLALADNFGEWARSSSDVTGNAGNYQYGILSWIADSVAIGAGTSFQEAFLDGVSIEWTTDTNVVYLCRATCLWKLQGLPGFIGSTSDTFFTIVNTAGVVTIVDTTGTTVTAIAINGVGSAGSAPICAFTNTGLPSGVIGVFINRNPLNIINAMVKIEYTRIGV